MTNPIHPNRRQVLAGTFAALVAGATRGRSGAAAAQDGEPAVATGLYFAGTGHNLHEPFLGRWNLWGGEGLLGQPISEERYQDKVGVVQNFERAALVFDPGLEAPLDIQGQPLPADVVTSAAPADARKQVTGCPDGAVFCQFFAQTGHTVSGRIGSFWSLYGDLALFGPPLSEPFTDGGVTVQLFERAILEDHGEDDVRLRDAWAAIIEAEGLASDPAFAPAPPTAGVTKLVKAEDGLRLRNSPDLDAEIVVVLPDNAEFIAPADATGEWVPGYADGYSGWVSASFLRTAPPLPKIDVSDWNPDIWQGASLGESNLRAEPTTTAEILEVLAYGAPVEVSRWVLGEEVFTGANMWAQVEPAGFLYSRNVGRSAPVLPPPLPPNAPTEGKWIDANLVQQLMVAYEGTEAVHTCPMTSGMAGWETPAGTYTVLARVANETMTSGAIGAEHFYKLEDVLYTQYFTDEGHAIHYAWWRTPETIGRPGSHGCLNLLLDDARWIWEWAEIGTTLIVHPDLPRATPASPVAAG